MAETTAKRGIPLHIQMLIGFLIGLGAGLAVYVSGAGGSEWVRIVTTYVTQPVGQIFLRMLFMMVIPLMFSALVMGVVEMGDIRSLGRAGWRMIAYTVVMSAIAVIIGLVAVNVFHPGNGVSAAAAQALLANAHDGAQAIITTSREAQTGAADNNILSVMFFALIFGIGMVLTKSEASHGLRRTIDGLFDVSMTLINLIIRLAPIAVACFMFNLSALFGWELLARLGAYVGVVVLALGVHFFVVYPLAIWLVGGMSPLRFFRGSQEAIVMAFSTASSNATLPTALRVAEINLGLPRRISRFVLTIGATANQNGTALFEGVTVLFLAQVFSVHLGLGQQVIVMLVCILGGIGTAGVPAGSLPVVALILAMVHVPPEGIGIVLGVDRFLDMCRTTLNVTGDLAAAVVVSRGESDATVPDIEPTEPAPAAPSP